MLQKAIGLALLVATGAILLILTQLKAQPYNVFTGLAALITLLYFAGVYLDHIKAL